MGRAGRGQARGGHPGHARAHGRPDPGDHRRGPAQGPGHPDDQGRRLSGKKAKKGKKGKGKGNGKKPHIKTIDGVNPGGWPIDLEEGTQGSWEWDEDLQAIDDVTGDYVHDPFIDDVTGDYVAPPDDSD